MGGDCMRLKDKVAVVTGGGNGIGRAICMAFADEGAVIVVADINSQAANGVADEIGRRGGQAIGVSMDVTETSEVIDCVEKTTKEYGKVHILVNNAGIEGQRANIWEANARDWRQTIEVHLFGNFNCTRAFLPKIMEQKWGRIITMASIQAKQASVQNSSYTAAKHALLGMTRTVAHEVAMAGYPEITVNAICPGIVSTDLVLGQKGALAQIASQYQIPLEQVIAMGKSKCLQNRFLETNEIAAMAVFLASNDARGITGQAINVCGGAIFH